MKFRNFLIFNFCIATIFANCPKQSIQGLTANDCYRFFSEPKTWFEAEEKCMDVGGHLASISGAFENAFMQDDVQELLYQAEGIWLGGNTVLVPGQWTWSDGIKFGYVNWDKGQPTGNTGSLCTQMSILTGRWNSQGCSSLQSPYICKINSSEPIFTTQKPIVCPTIPTIFTTKTISPCTPDYTYWNGNCYKTYYQNELTLRYDMSEARCVQDGAHLTSIHSAAENYFIMSFAFGYDTWIGMYQKNGVWSWKDGSLVDYTRWGDASTGFKPNNKNPCAFLVAYVDYQPSGEWTGYWDSNYVCDTAVGAAVCKKPAVH